MRKYFKDTLDIVEKTVKIKYNSFIKSKIFCINFIKK